MLTIKSDDWLGRTQAYKAILQGQPIPESNIPESFKLLVRELNGLSLGIAPLMEDRADILQEDDAEEVVSLEADERPAPEALDEASEVLSFDTEEVSEDSEE